MTELDIEELIEAAQRWNALREQAERYELRLFLDAVVGDPDAVRRAFDVLTSDQPLRSEYPNGDPAHPPYTPRQVLLLAGVEFQVITHEAKAYQEALQSLREELGRMPKRACVGVTKRGDACQSWAMPYSPEPLCHTHGTNEMREHNSYMKGLESKRLNEELEKLGLVAASTGKAVE